MRNRSELQEPNLDGLSRRDWLRLSALGALGGSVSGWFEPFAARAADDPQRRRACILLWMSGGPSQMDTFDLKPGHENGGKFKEIATQVPGMKISEHLPQLAARAEHLAIMRSMTSKEGDHGRATQFVHTGYLPVGAIRYPTLGSLVANELGSPAAELPNFVSIAPFRTLAPAAYSAGFLGPRYAPLLVGNRAPAADPSGGAAAADSLNVDDMELPAGLDGSRAAARLELLGSLNERFLGDHTDAPAVGHKMAYERAVRLMRSPAGHAFKLEEEPDKLRDSYGRNRFGQGCLLARRLVERGVPFVEVTLGGLGDNNALGWDTHAENFETVQKLSKVLDPAWSTLLDDLKDRGLLDTTLIVWMGEFGRTPKINPASGRDHFPQAWSTVLAGGGIRGGQAYGRTSADGMTVEDRPVTVPDLLATACRALGIDPTKQNNSNLGRPIRIADPSAKPVAEVLA